MNIARPPTIYSDASYTALQIGVTSIIQVETVTGLITPTLPSDAVNKDYVDTLIASVPALPANSIQFNSDPAGHLTGSSDFIYIESTKTLKLLGHISMESLFSTITFPLSNGVITGLATPTNPLDAVNKSYVDNITFSPGLPAQSIQFNSSPAGNLVGSSDLIYDEGSNMLTLGGNSIINFSSNTGIITGIVNPTSNLDVANKQYVDSAISSAPGLPFTSVQFNDSGLLGGSSNFTWNNGTNTITVNGLINNTGTTNATSTTTGTITTAGGIGVQKNIFVGGNCYASAYLTSSDERLKYEIELIDKSDLDKLDNIKGYSYFLNDDDDELHYGFLAGELENTGFENLVKTVDNYKRVNYQSFIPLLLEKIKALESRISELEKN
jgi:hypothetical protein